MKFGTEVTCTDLAFKNGVPSRKVIKNGCKGIFLDEKFDGSLILCIFKPNKTASWYAREFIVEANQ